MSQSSSSCSNDEYSSAATFSDDDDDFSPDHEFGCRKKRLPPNAVTSATVASTAVTVEDAESTSFLDDNLLPKKCGWQHKRILQFQLLNTFHKTSSNLKESTRLGKQSYSTPYVANLTVAVLSFFK